MDEPRPQGLSGFARVYTGFGAALIILTLMDLAGIATARILDDRIKWQTHTYEVLQGTTQISNDLRAIDAAYRGFIATGNPGALDEYRGARTALHFDMERVRSITVDNASQQQNLRDMSDLIAKRLAFIDAVNGVRASNRDSALALMQTGVGPALRQSINVKLRAVSSSEETLLRGRNERLSTTLAAGKWISVGGLLLSLLLVIISVRMIRAEVRRRRTSSAQLEASESRLRDFLDSASDLIQSSTPDARLIYVNRSLLKTLGYEESEVIGQPSEMLIAPDQVAYCRGLFARILAGETVTDIETVYLRKDGRRVHVSGSSNCRFEDGRPVASRTILHDVTRQHEVDSMKDEFVSIVSHELRTPLTSIRGALGLLANGLLGDVQERGKRMLDVAIANTDRLVRLINDILDVERIESGAMPMTLRRTALDDVFMQVRDSMRPIADKAGITLDIASIDADINADADRIVQTMTNLVSNAIKFSPPASVIRVDANRESDHVHIRVIDQGRGIPADMLETVFTRFQQVDATDAREKGGSGLGLAISRGIVEQHNGRIWVESTLDRGATFHVVLPMLAPAPDLDAALRADARAASGESPLVLICDDDEDVRNVLGAMLEDRGYRVVTAADGATAIGLAAEQRPAVLLLDLLMPGDYDGRGTMAALKARPDTRDIPIIMISGSGAESTFSKGTAHTADNGEMFMRKPVEAASLVRAIEHALTHWGNGANVLVVEDDDDLARILVEFLRTHGLQAMHAPNGKDAVSLSQQTEPALIILDLMLPDTDGFAVVDWLRQHDRLRNVPILIYTAIDLDEAQRARLNIAPELLFTKSRMAPEHLVDRVAAMIGRITWRHDQAGV